MRDVMLILIFSPIYFSRRSQSRPTGCRAGPRYQPATFHLPSLQPYTPASQISSKIFPARPHQKFPFHSAPHRPLARRRPPSTASRACPPPASRASPRRGRSGPALQRHSVEHLERVGGWRRMYGRRASQLLKEVDSCEAGQLVPFNVSFYPPPPLSARVSQLWGSEWPVIRFRLWLFLGRNYGWSSCIVEIEFINVHFQSYGGNVICMVYNYQATV